MHFHKVLWLQTRILQQWVRHCFGHGPLCGRFSYWKSWFPKHYQATCSQPRTRSDVQGGHSISQLRLLSVAVTVQTQHSDGLRSAATLNLQTPLQRPAVLFFFCFIPLRWHAIAAQSCQSQQGSIEGAPLLFQTVSFIRIKKVSRCRPAASPSATRCWTLFSSSGSRWSSTAVNSKR